MHRTLVRSAAVAALIATPALAPAQEHLSDLESKSPHKLSKDELQALWPGASVSRVSPRGSTHRWTNDADGTLTLSTDNAGVGPHAASSTPGKWSIANDGRLCVTIEWRLIPTEDWCRFVFQTSGGYWTARSDAPGEKVHRLDIRKRS